MKYNILTVDVDNSDIFEITETNDPKRRIPKLNGNIKFWIDGTGEQKPFHKWEKFKNSKQVKHYIIPKSQGVLVTLR